MVDSLNTLPKELLEHMAYLKIVPSYRCGRGCKYCYNRFLSQQCVANRQSLLSAIWKIVGAQRKPFTSEILGGEPLIDDTIQTTLSVLSILGDSPHCSQRIIATACGDVEVLAKLRGYAEIAYISTDISRNEANKKVRNANEFRDIQACLESHGIEMIPAVVLWGDESDKDIDEFIFACDDAGIRRVCFGHIAFEAINETRLSHYVNSFYRLMVLKYAMLDRINLGGDVLETLNMIVRGQQRNNSCHCGESSLVIQPDGSVTANLCADLNDLRSLSIADYLEMKRERLLLLPRAECVGCKFWGACQGGCMGQSIKMNRSHLAREENFCRLLKGIWTRIERDIERL